MIVLDGSSLTLDRVGAIADRGETVALDPPAAARVIAARQIIDAKIDAGEPVYGVNTGFGALAEVPIASDALGALQLNLIRSHAAGFGEPLAPRAVRAMMALRANVLAKGYSGVRLETLEALITLVNRGICPRVPSRGSVGASGDLAPLAHLALVLVGEGEALVADGGAGSTDGGGRSPVVPGMTALRAAGLDPVRLEAKEGLALINGTQASTAVLALAVLDAERVARAADIAAALSIDALRGSVRPLDPRIHAARPFAGQIVAARNMAALLEGSAINASHADCGRVQDAYSLRCAPQVHGAAREALEFARRIAEIEANGATDNPMVFPETGEIVSGGNFHGAPIALAADLLAIAMAPVATISERRTERLVDPAASGLPPFLSRVSGVQSGYMLPQVAAAAAAAEVKTLAAPASVDSIPTSAGREDHVSMSMGAALKAARAVELVRHVVAIEILCACQAIDLLAPLTTSAALARVHARVRADVPTLADDRPPAPDIERIVALIASGALGTSCGVEVK